jgi:hypothetical protein
MAGIFEWYSSNSKIDYPFDDRQSDEVHELFVDAYVAHSDFRTVEQRLRLYSFDPAGDVELRFEDNTVLTVLSAADNFVATVFGKYTVYRWHKYTTLPSGLTDADIAVRLVVVTDELPEFIFPLFPAEGFLLASVVHPHVGRVRRMAVALPGVPLFASQFTAHRVSLEPGNNIAVREVTPTVLEGFQAAQAPVVRKPKTIAIDATPGAGAGRFIDCDIELPSPIRRINRTQPNGRGNFQLEGRDCVWVERRVLSTGAADKPNTDYAAIMVAALLQLHQDCKACCDCADYGSAYEAITDTWNRALAVSARIETLRLKYHELRAKMLVGKALKEIGLGIHLRLVSRPDFHIAISATVFNSSSVDMGLTDIQFSIAGPGAYSVTPGSGILDAEFARGLHITPAPNLGGFAVTVPTLKKGTYAAYSFEVRFDTPGGRPGKVVTVQVDATSGAETASDIQATELIGPLQKV